MLGQETVPGGLNASWGTSVLKYWPRFSANVIVYLGQRAFFCSYPGSVLSVLSLEVLCGQDLS